ncbi:protein LATE ELONGATED HYPOCOTYL-like [Bidens hawaiensis]|uniref:protein LATE ELONGATED HYPOCOTYL-like n=1 Tax=Bidens hawaiensis TaxID=980011 RepID=UPI0040498F7C
MDSNSSASGKTLNIKTRKPYTITKQRERWTEDEHNRFLEALKLYGRAWQRIEEHIGTKTAVQIRSHAQKFFTKLEKEAIAKGIPVSQALDVEIPPPRPKRKPNYPYPRKSDPKTNTQVAHKDTKQTTLVSSLQLLDLETKPLTEKTSEEVEHGTAEEAPSLENENSIPNESYITNETRKHQEPDQDDVKHTNITSNSSLFESSHPSHDIQGVRTCPRHVPVQVVDVNQGIMAKTSVPTETPLHESNANNSGQHANLSVNLSAASETSGHHNNVTFHPYFAPFSDNQDSYKSFLHVSSTIPSLIVSSLLQNPSAHAAASYAAKFWHPEASSADSYSRDQLNPSMIAIATATVAAATAWWSAHGLLPVCTPFYQGGYSCAFGTPGDGNLVNKAPSEGVLREEKMDADKTESAADLSSSEDSEKNLNEVIPVDTNETVLVVDSRKLTGLGKQVDRSSCGSNTTSSSEIDTNILEKDEKETEETKVADVKEPISRRGRNAIAPNESWKEVSEEGRLAFQALFTREVLPQSFSDIHMVAEKGQPNMVSISELDRTRMSHRHTGFKPYKRCSIEAKESIKIASAGNQNDEKGPKRMRVATEAST